MIRLATWNLCLGIAQKKDLLTDILKIKNIDILCLQETEILRENSDYYSINKFNLELSNCLPKSRSCIYINEKLKYERLTRFDDSCFEIIVILFSEFVLVSYYRTFKLPENFTHFSHFVRAMEIFDEILATYSTSNILITGDFNLDYSKINDPAYSKNGYFDHLNAIFDPHGLIQLINEPTWHRFSENTLKESTLDHIYTNNILLLSNIEKTFLNVGDHDLIQFDFKTNLEKIIPKKNVHFERLAQL